MNIKEQRTKLKTIALSGIFMALVVVASSSMLSIPVPGGHLYMNDFVICSASIILGPIPAMIVGGVGAFLGDFFFYPTPMWVSLVTHGLQALVVSLCSRYIFKKHQFKKRPIVASSIGVALGALINVVGYTFGRAFIYGTPEAAIAKFPFQIIQACVGAVLAIILCYPLGIKRLACKMLK